jgi:putative transposase
LLARTVKYKVAPELNPGKRRQVSLVMAEWQRTAIAAFDWYWQPFLRGGLFNPRMPVSGPKSTFPDTRLVTSQKDLLLRAVSGQAQGWASNLANRLTRAIVRSAADEGLRHQLLWINSMRAWLLPYREQVALLNGHPSRKLSALTPAASRLMRKMVRCYLTRFKLPDPTHLPVQFNVNSATFGRRQTSASPWAEHWLRASTLERGVKVELPLMANAYAESHKGETAKTFALEQRNGELFVVAVKKFAPTPWDVHRVETLAIDLGLRNLMATSEGDLRGIDFLDKLQRYDRQLIAIQRGLQEAGVRRLGQCGRFRRHVERIRGFLKTEMQTHLRFLLERHRPRRVVIEALLFTGASTSGRLSRRMNRLLRRFGQRYFAETLKQASDEFGFELVTVDPAFTSQTCHRCGFVHANNRTASRFGCLACRHEAHADVNAGKNLRRRSATEASPSYVSRDIRWKQALTEWAFHFGARPSKRVRLVGEARAGLRALISGRSARLTAKQKERLSPLLESTSANLLAGLSNFADLLGESPQVSTR